MTGFFKNRYVLSAFTILSLFFLSCAGTKAAKDSAEPAEISSDDQKDDQKYIDASSVRLTVPGKHEISFFYEIPKDIVDDVCMGTPQSLERAVGRLRSFGRENTDKEKILIFVASAIMRIVWPQEKISWDTPGVPQNNAYVGVINSVEQGVYDSSSGGDDFLTLVLPSLVLLTNRSRSDYFSGSHAALSEALKIKSDSVLADYLFGVLCRRQSQYGEAVIYFRKASDGSAGNFQTSYALADALMKNGQIQEASEIAKDLVLSYPNDTELLKLCAQTFFALKNYKESELYAARVLQQNPADAEYILFRARILLEEGDYIRAVSFLDVYARNDTVSRDYLMLRSRVQREWNKNLRGAVETIEQAMARYPDDPEVTLAAAKLASSTGERVAGKTAGELASAVLSTDADNTDALDVFIKDLISRKLWNDAYAVSLRLINKQDVSLEMQHTHIEICLALNRTNEAWNIAESLYEKFPKEEIALRSYLEVLYALGRRTESIDLIDKLLPSASSRLKSFLYYRRSFLASGETAVLADLRASLISNSRNEDALYKLYSIYYEKKDYRRAQYYLKQVVALHPSNEEFLRKNEELESLLRQ
ncbi:tetratricopeptide repeat protein [Treponema parvum]|uniref:tetratricopeptide repeat protein n=1 Tax=Treponema parvum TaxID=138851 RepID=UPI001AEC587D|nr:tetratricopeptide repeat protein [Treponema parvum]QTQ16941.1 tetratricopeptide repeat protein [Treponema parvum]